MRLPAHPDCPLCLGSAVSEQRRVIHINCEVVVAIDYVPCPCTERQLKEENPYDHPRPSR